LQNEETRGGRQASRQGIPLPQPCHAACILILPRSGKIVTVQFRCPMDRHRPCFSSRGALVPPHSPTTAPKVVGKGTRRPPDGVAVTPLAFCLYPPLHPPAGEFPTAHPSEVSRGSRHSGASAMSRPLHFLHSFDYLPPSRSWIVHEHGYVSPFFSYVRPLASLYLASIIGQFLRTPHPPALYKVPPLANSFHCSAG